MEQETTWPIVIDVPHDGRVGKYPDQLVGDHRLGRDYGAREIFLGHPVFRQVCCEPWRDLCDGNRLAETTGADGRFKTHAMSLVGEAQGPSLWKFPGPSESTREDLNNLVEDYFCRLEEAINDIGTRFVLFGHTMPQLANGSDTAEVPAGQQNALVSIGNGGNAEGEGDNLLCPAEQAQFLVQQTQQHLRQVLGESLDDYIEGREIVALNNYSGATSAARFERTKNRETPSVLIEINRGLVGHPEDPMFGLMSHGGLNPLSRDDHQVALHRVVGGVLEAYGQQYLR